MLRVICKRTDSRKTWIEILLWHYQMESFSVLLALCEGNPPGTGGFPWQRPVTRSFDVFFDLRLNKRLSTQSRPRWFQTPSGSLWRHCYVGESHCDTEFWHGQTHSNVSAAVELHYCLMTSWTFPYYWTFVYGNHRSLRATYDELWCYRYFYRHCEQISQ